MYNIVCASCGCIGHDRSDYTLVSVLDQRLSCLKVEPRSLIPYDFSCGVSALDTQNIMIDPLGIQREVSGSNLWLCSTCHPRIMLGKRPPESLANFRWVGSVPDELKDLTWIEELLVAHAHLVGRVVRLQARNQSSYFGIKGHIILLPQDTTLLLDLLPMSPASLPDVVRVVWTGKSAPDRDRLRSHIQNPSSHDSNRLRSDNASGRLDVYILHHFQLYDYRFSPTGRHGGRRVSTSGLQYM